MIAKELYNRYMNGAKENHFCLAIYGLLGKKPSIPHNLNTCLTALDVMLSREDKEVFFEWEEEKFVAHTHHNLGRHIRNEWKLWSNKSALYKWFKKRKIWHADDMSGIILTTYYRHVHKLPINFNDQINSYLKYWQDSEVCEADCEN